MPEKSISCTNGDLCQLAPEIDALKQEVSELAELVSTDTLTGLNNYRHFTNIITQEIERSKRTAQPTTLIMVDADHFKKVNDDWGHETGNEALKLIANCLKRNIRKLDIACRYGGEEFAVILPSSDIGTSAQVAERIREAVESAVLTANNGTDTIPLTVSLGLSTYIVSQDDDWHKLVERADQELYRAKQQGRNQVCYTVEEVIEQQVSEDEKSALFDMFKD
ncbi:MAG: GGDEF domain-containing protein [Cellvibrionaceae bacterium]